MICHEKCIFGGQWAHLLFNVSSCEIDYVKKTHYETQMTEGMACDIFPLGHV